MASSFLGGEGPTGAKERCRCMLICTDVDSVGLPKYWLKDSSISLPVCRVRISEPPPPRGPARSRRSRVFNGVIENPPCRRRRQRGRRVTRGWHAPVPKRVAAGRGIPAVAPRFASRSNCKYSGRHQEKEKKKTKKTTYDWSCKPVQSHLIDV